jgi:hypothetical protein
MRSFELVSTSPDDFVDRVRSGLAARGYDRNLSIRLDADRLVIQFRWMGTTSFEYRVTERGDGFRADLVDQRVAPLHAPFTDRFEGYFDQALEELGAKTV